MTETREVLAAAARLVARFGAHDSDGYFACFAPEASFLFHNHPHRLDSREAYRALWRQWESRDGFRVLGCASFDGAVQRLGPDIALFTHRVETRLSLGGAEQMAQERENILFQRQADGCWLAVHEHLSPHTPG